MAFKGYVDLDDTLYFLFTTRQFSTGAPFTLAGTPALSVYEENNATQITSGVSISADYDSVTGLNQATIVATTANGYEAGKTYDVVITTGTVDSVSVVGEVVGQFKVGAIAANVEEYGGTAGTFASGRPEVNTSHVSGTAQTANDNGADINTLLTRIVGTLAAGTHTAQTGDVFAALPSNFSDLGINASGHVTRVVLVDTTTANTDMRGTDGANTTTPPTAAANADAVWDEDIVAAHNTADTAGAILDDLLTPNNFKATGFSTHSAADVWAAITNAAANKIADHVLRRTAANARASSDGDTATFRSLLGAISKLVNKFAVNGSNVEIMQENDTTVFGTQALTTDASADPVTGVDTV